MVQDRDLDLNIKKPVQALVLQPRKGKLSVVARKLYNVIIHSTVEQIAEYELGGRVLPAEHLFECRLSELVQPIQMGNSDLRSKAKEYLTQMADIRLDWEAPDAKSSGLHWTNMALLAEAQLTKTNADNPNSEVVVRWAFPPSIIKEIRHPEMYARLSIYQIAKLSTYEAVSLYEICARYRNSPSGVTSVNEPLWWIKALSNKVPDKDPVTGLPKWREWRKFKVEKVKKAVGEINELTDLIVELIEKKEGVQFSVARKVSDFLPLPKQLNPEIAEAAIKLGLKLTDIASLIRNGQTEVGLRAAFAKMALQDPEKIVRKFAYLNKILEEVNPFIAAGVVPIDANASAYETQVYPKPITLPKPEVVMVPTFKDERRAQARKALKLLSAHEQLPIAYAALAELREKKMDNPGMALKVDSGAWETAPVLFARMVDIYAERTFGPDWAVDQSPKG